MSSDPGNTNGRPPGPPGRLPAGAQGASRGGRRPDETIGDPDREPASGGSGQPPFGGYPFNQGRRPGSGWSGGGASSGPKRGGATFLGLPIGLIYAIGIAIIGIVIFGSVCGKPNATGSIAGQVKALNADRSISTLAGAQVVVRGANQTYAATSTDVPADAEGEAAYNYRIENVPPGNYSMAVTPPAGATLQPEQDISFKVESGQLFPQSVMLLAQGIQKPRPLAANELQPGEAGGYVNDRGERVVYRDGGGFDATDALLLYLLWRNPGGYGYGYPPVIVSSPGGGFGSGGSSYRVTNPPSQTRTGQTVTQQKPTTPGQGATRPSSSGGATGSGPIYAPSGSSGSGSSAGSSSGSTQTRPSTSSGGSVSAPSVPSQGSTRPSSSSSSPSRSSAPSRSSGSSGGGRR